MELKIDFHGLAANEELAQSCVRALANSNDQLELEAMLAELALETVDELAYLPEPTVPIVLHQYETGRRMSKRPWEEQEKEKKRVHEMPEVQAYNTRKLKVLHRNRSNVEALERYIRIWIAWDEPAKGQKCWLLYNDYPGIIIVDNMILWEKKSFIKDSPKT